jgi:DHA1 family bicyclomycin/chloramphenicol resistance-like MFS transporter
MIVFSAGIVATKIVRRLGLDRTIYLGLALACVGGSMVLLFAVFDQCFLPFLAGTCVFLLGMGMVNPLGSAQTLSPFGDRAGVASAMLGFWQMLAAALGVALAAVIAKDAMTGLGLVLVFASIVASALYQMRHKA